MAKKDQTGKKDDKKVVDPKKKNKTKQTTATPHEFRGGTEHPWFRGMDE